MRLMCPLLDVPSTPAALSVGLIIMRLLHDLVEASFELRFEFRCLLLGDQLIPWELHPLVTYTSAGLVDRCGSYIILKPPA